MSRISKVSLYHRDANGYHRCDPRGIYPADSTTFVLRYEKERDKRTWETLPPGTDFATARRMALEKELFLSSPEGRFPTLKSRLTPTKTDAAPTSSGRIRIADAIEKYIDALWVEGNQRPRTIKDKAFELGCWAQFARTERKKEHVEDLVRVNALTANVGTGPNLSDLPTYRELTQVNGSGQSGGFVISSGRAELLPRPRVE